MAADGAFEERFAVVNLILGALREKAEEYGQADHQLEVLYEMLLHLRTQVRKNAEEEKLGISLLEEFVQEQENSLQSKDGTDLSKRTEIPGDGNPQAEGIYSDSKERTCAVS